MKVLLTFLTFCLISFNSYAVQATHGMVLFGHQKLMAYHLPMFHSIHAKQVVLEYTLPDEVKTQLLSYQVQGFLTFVPAPFDLESFLAHPFSLKGDVYLGHFEKDGVVVMSDVTIENIQILYQGNIKKEESPTGDYYKLFGTPSDLYQVHLLAGGKEFDHILQAKIDVTSKKNVDLAQKAINTGNSIFSFGLLKDGQTSYFKISTDIDGICKYRRCDIFYDELSVLSEKTYFTDSVM